MRLILISDTHGARPEVPSGDCLIHAGDLTHFGSFRELQSEVNWLKSLPHRYKILIAGNHDLALYNLYEKGLEHQLRKFLHPLIYLRDSGAEIAGKRFYGSPWVLPWAGAFNLPSHKLREKWDAIPTDTQVLITHQPPAGMLDGGVGCKHLRGVLGRLPQLEAAAYGHIHAAAGTLESNGVVFCNAAQSVVTVDVGKFRTASSPYSALAATS